MNNIPELLAPAGSMEALKAAVQNGADAVYLGGKMFGARQYAPNFDLEELREAVDYAHLYGVRIYLTLNILVDNGEFPEFIDYLYQIYRTGVDAVIVQDLGAASAVRHLLPELELYASTQMTVHNSDGVEFLREMGFSRVILAREVTLQNIKSIGQKTKFPLEVFIHGALCVSYSGQCLMSSMIGGRSGNRGRCAQPCRLPYALVDEKGEELYKGHLLSPRDLYMIEHLPLLAEAGVVALKVEGRMKRPEYVATVIRNYRQVLDDPLRQVHPENTKELAQIFNRGFTTGYFFEKPGSELMSYQRPNNRGILLGRVLSYDRRKKEVRVSLVEPLSLRDGYEIWVTSGGRIAGEVRSLKQNGRLVESAALGEVSFPIKEGNPKKGDRVFKTLDIALMEKARRSFQGEKGIKRIPLDFHVKIKRGCPVLLTVSDDKGNRAEIRGTCSAETAIKHALTGDLIKQQLNRLGNTVFTLNRLDMSLDENVIVPVSELNTLRRQAVEELEKLRRKSFEKPFVTKEVYEKRYSQWKKASGENGQTGRAEKYYVTGKDAKISVNVGDMESLKEAVRAGAQIVYFGGEKLRRKEGISPEQYGEAVKLCRSYGAEPVLMLPRVYHEDEAGKIERMCELALAEGIESVLAGNPGALHLARRLKIPFIKGDYTLNIFNDYTALLLVACGIKQLGLSPELTLDQIGKLKAPGQAGLECLVFGRIPLMITEHCAVGCILGKGHRARGCPQPCRAKEYGLKDRMNMVFPLECDEYCRMRVYNPKTLNLIEKLPELLSAGIGLLRIEAERENPYWVSKATGILKAELHRCQEYGPEYKIAPTSKEVLKSLAPQGFTTGHYYRGVL